MHIELLAAMEKASSEVFSLGGVLSGSSATFLCPECVEVQQNRGLLPNTLKPVHKTAKHPHLALPRASDANIPPKQKQAKTMNAAFTLLKKSS